MKILVLDNYDSFTYNLVQIVEKITAEKIDVFRNDKITLEKVGTYDKIILSPGPGIPAEAGLLLPIIKEYASTKPILGVCLGEQAIGEAFGATLENMKEVYHGVATDCILTANKTYLFEGLRERFSVGRYHSWIVSEKNFPDSLETTAVDDEGRIMALQHKEYKHVQGVQFHPESVLTPNGEQILQNWIKYS